MPYVRAIHFFIFHFAFLLLHGPAFQPEIGLGVLEANAADKTSKEVRIMRDLTPFHIQSDQIAKQPPLPEFEPGSSSTFKETAVSRATLLRAWKRLAVKLSA